MRIGFIGTGLMGAAMVERLLTQKPVMVYNRSPEKLQPLQRAGADIASSVLDVLQQCEPIILMVSDGAAIQSLLLSESTKTGLNQRTIIQMGTIGSSESRAFQTAVEAAGGQYLEAPVLGSLPEAKAGKLLIMVGATSEQFQRCLPVLQLLGTEPQWIGEVGTAAALKLALNQLIASLTTAFSLSLSFVQQQGVPVEVFMNILRQSALYAPTFDKKLERMLDQNYANPNFPTKHLLKDTGLFLREAEPLGLAVDSLAGVQQILETACDAGWAESDYSALFAAVSAALRSPEA
ncbi:MAG: NAD(P)-dependent oxidoreductase [Elainella sp. Prado103]|nr:NAD(P)-dependent oxidoreductase [Elainella sp. Prado103]